MTIIFALKKFFFFLEEEGISIPVIYVSKVCMWLARVAPCMPLILLLQCSVLLMKI